MGKTAEKIWNLPNILTMLRMALIPVYVVVYKKGFYYAALLVFLIASLTDLLDGRIARKYQLVTNFGKVMDPLADKLMCVTVLFSLSSSGTIHWIPVTIVIVKELIMLASGTYLLRNGIIIQSQMIGKAAQWLFILALAFSFFHDFFESWVLPVDVLLLWAAVATTLLALIFYAVNVTKQANLIEPRKKSAL
mgnify:CR=1 FL=1